MNNIPSKTHPLRHHVIRVLYRSDGTALTVGVGYPYKPLFELYYLPEENQRELLISTIQFFKSLQDSGGATVEGIDRLEKLLHSLVEKADELYFRDKSGKEVG